MTLNPASTLGELVADEPARAAVFDRLRLDYCCNGSQTVDEACQRHGLETHSVLEALEAVDVDAPTKDVESVDWRRASNS